MTRLRLTLTILGAFAALATCACKKDRPTPSTNGCGVLAVRPCPPQIETASIVAEGAPVRAPQRADVDSGEHEVASRVSLGPYVLRCAYGLFKGNDPSAETFSGLETCTLQEGTCPAEISIPQHVAVQAVALRKSAQGILAVTIQFAGSSRGVPLACFERTEK